MFGYDEYVPHETVEEWIELPFKLGFHCQGSHSADIWDSLGRNLDKTHTAGRVHDGQGRTGVKCTAFGIIAREHTLLYVFKM